jgi:hypothetical protein
VGTPGATNSSLAGKGKIMKRQKPWTITAKSSSALEIAIMEVVGEDFWTGEGNRGSMC